MSKLYIIGETNCRGEIRTEKFAIEKHMVIADLQKAKTLVGDETKLERLFDDIEDEYGYGNGKGQAVISLIQSDFQDADMTTFIDSNIEKINNEELISIELEETIYGMSNTKEKALLAFHNIDDNDWE